MVGLLTFSPKKSIHTEPCHTIDQGIEIVKNTCMLQYVEASSQKAKRLHYLLSLKESSATDEPEGTVSNKMFKIPQTSEEVSELHQNQHRGIVIIPRFQHHIKHGSTVDPSHYKINMLRHILRETPSHCTNMH